MLPDVALYSKQRSTSISCSTDEMSAAMSASASSRIDSRTRSSAPMSIARTAIKFQRQYMRMACSSFSIMTSSRI